MKSYWLSIPHHFTLQFGGFAPHQKTHGEWSGRVLRRKYRRNVSDVNKTYYNKSCKKDVFVLLLVLFFVFSFFLFCWWWRQWWQWWQRWWRCEAVCAEFRGTCWKSRELLNEQSFQKKNQTNKATSTKNDLFYFLQLEFTYPIITIVVGLRLL